MPALLIYMKALVDVQMDFRKERLTPDDSIKHPAGVESHIHSAVKIFPPPPLHSDYARLKLHSDLWECSSEGIWKEALGVLCHLFFSPNLPNKITPPQQKRTCFITFN